ncbi:unnamed protein product [Linum trigynum]|uniref:Uncharacterized protein n=1 Tax=Linum trigynum TaxID=586398 RepID=A0AAV2CFW9_9ROSI
MATVVTFSSNLATPFLKEVIRVKEIGFKKYRRWNVLARFRKEDIGRCFAAPGGLSWIMAFGAPPPPPPPHLKSKAISGEFVDFENGDWSDPFIRIKVRLNPDVTKEIPLLFGSTLFMGKIVSPPVADLRRDRLIDRKMKQLNSSKPEKVCDSCAVMRARVFPEK